MFDPDKYLAKKELKQGRFNPDAYLAKKGVKEPVEEKEVPGRPLEAASMGAAQSATLGYLPELQAAAEPAVFGLLNKLTGKNVESDENFSERKKGYKEKLTKLEEENPKAYTAGEVGGAIATAPLAGAATKGVLGVSKLGGLLKKGVDAGGKIGLLSKGAQAAASGALVGAVQNTNEGESRLENAKEGAIFGAAGQAAGDIIGSGIKGVKKGIEGLKGMAEKRAFKALGPYQRDVIKNANRLNEMGRVVLDEGILDHGWENTSKKAAEALDNTGKQIGDYVERVNQKAFEMAGANVPSMPGKVSPPPKFGIDVPKITDSLKADLITNGKLGDDETNTLFSKLIDRFGERNKDFLGVADAEKMKREVGKMIKWDRLPNADIPDKERFYRSLYDKLKQGFEDATEAVQGELGPQERQQFVALKKKYSALAEAENISKKRSQKEFANRMISASDYGTGLATGASAAMMAHDPVSAATHGIAGFLLGAMGNKAARYFGNEGAAKALDRVSKALEGNKLLYNKYYDKLATAAKSNPEALSAMVVNLDNQLNKKEKPKGLLK